MVDASNPHYLISCDPVTGSIDPTDYGFNNTIYALDVEGGDLFAAGNFTVAGGAPRERVAAIDLSTGALEARSTQVDNDVYGIGVYGDDVFLAGRFTVVGGVPRNGIAAADRTPGAVTPWNPSLSNVSTLGSVRGDSIEAHGDRLFHSTSCSRSTARPASRCLDSLPIAAA